eukprot:s20_g24.t1
MDSSQQLSDFVYPRSIENSIFGVFGMAEEEPTSWKDEQALEEAPAPEASAAFAEEEGEQEWHGEGDVPKPDEDVGDQEEEGELMEDIPGAATEEGLTAEDADATAAQGEEGVAEAKAADEVMEEEKEDGSSAWWAAEKPTEADGEAEPEASAAASDDPAARVEIDVGCETTAWLLEEDGRRLRKLERLAGGEAEATEEGQLKVTPSSAEPPPGGCGTGHSWCEIIARALCAMRTGEDVELPATVADFASSMEFGDGLGIMILEVPAAVSKKPISGKDGAKLLELCDTQDVVAVFTTAKEAASGSGEATGFAEGDTVEAKYGSSWASAVVLEAAEPGAKVKIKWDYDKTEAELESWDVQKKEPAQDAQEVVEFSAGDKVEAKYGSSFYDAEVLSMSMEDGKVKLKWGHDGSEAELDASEVKLKPDSQEKEAAPPAELKEGDKVEAKYGDSFHDAEVVTPETEDGKVKVKWGFDGSEAEVDPAEVKLKPEAPPEPPDGQGGGGGEKLLVIGFLRPRLEVELRTMNRIESKAPGHCLTNPRASDEGPGAGADTVGRHPGQAHWKRRCDEDEDRQHLRMQLRIHGQGDVGLKGC